MASSVWENHPKLYGSSVVYSADTKSRKMTRNVPAATRSWRNKMNIVFSKNCPSCGGIPDQPVGWTGKCPFCGRQLGHDSSTCMCDTCQDFRDAQMGIDLLRQMKEMKAGLAQQQTRVTISSGSAKFCSQCGKPVAANQNFCVNCGNKLK